MSKTDDTLPTLRKLVKHAGAGVLPEGWLLTDDGPAPLYTKVEAAHVCPLFLGPEQSRDLCTGYWLRMLLDNLNRWPTLPRFKDAATFILALDADVAKKCFKRKDGA